MTTMKLSEAIRLGAMWRPQADGEFLSHAGGTCAQGAALDAIGYALYPDIGVEAHDAFVAAWPWANETLVACPQSSCCRRMSVKDLIPHLNNTMWGAHGWTRERIADFVERIEQEDPSVTQDPQAERVAVGA